MSGRTEEELFSYTFFFFGFYFVSSKDPYAGEGKLFLRILSIGVLCLSIFSSTKVTLSSAGLSFLLAP
jgi:hypothetical protein